MTSKAKAKSKGKGKGAVKVRGRGDVGFWGFKVIKYFPRNRYNLVYNYNVTII